MPVGAAAMDNVGWLDALESEPPSAHRERDGGGGDSFCVFVWVAADWVGR